MDFKGVYDNTKKSYLDNKTVSNENKSFAKIKTKSIMPNSFLKHYSTYDFSKTSYLDNKTTTRNVNKEY